MQQLEIHPYDRAFEILPEPTLLVDEAGGLALVNAASEALLGAEISASAALGALVATALPWLGPAVARVLAGEDDVTLEAKVPSPYGPRFVAARLRRVRERGGDPCGVVAVLEDVTEKRTLDAQQRSAERVAAFGTLAADLAHEVSNPIACVVAGLSFLESEHARLASALAPAELVEAKLALEEARDAALRVRRIVRSLQSLGLGPSKPPRCAAAPGGASTPEPDQAMAREGVVPEQVPITLSTRSVPRPPLDLAPHPVAKPSAP